MLSKGESYYFQMYKQGCDLYPVCKRTFYSQRHYITTIREYHDISITHADGQRFTHFGSSSLLEHIQ